MRYSKSNQEYMHQCAKKDFIEFFTNNPDKIEEFNSYINIDRYTQNILSGNGRYHRSIDHHFEEFVLGKPFKTIFEEIEEYIDGDRSLFEKFCRVYSDISHTTYEHPSQARFHILMNLKNVNMKNATYTHLKETLNKIKSENDSDVDQIMFKSQRGFVLKEKPSKSYILNVYNMNIEFTIFKKHFGFITLNSKHVISSDSKELYHHVLNLLFGDKECKAAA
jgi:hypothetical protein